MKTAIKFILRSWFVVSIIVCALDASLGADVGGVVGAMVCGFWWGMTEEGLAR